MQRCVREAGRVTGVTPCSHALPGVLPLTALSIAPCPSRILPDPIFGMCDRLWHAVATTSCMPPRMARPWRTCACAPQSDPVSPLYTACQLGFTRIVKTLLATSGIDVDRVFVVRTVSPSL